MALLPLAGWAETIIDNEYDVNVVPSDGSAVWNGRKPEVQAGWLIVQSEAPTKPTKAQVADQIEVVDLADYNVGNHTYVLKLKAGAPGYVDIATGVEDHYNRYFLHTNAQNTATLTITKFTEDPFIDGSLLGYVNDDLTYTASAQALLSGGATATANGVAVPVIYTLNPAGNPLVTFDSYANVKGTNAGEYTVYYQVAGTDNYAGTDWVPMAGHKNIAKATQNFAAEGAAPTANTWTYDATAHALVIAPTSPVANGTYEYCATNSTNDEDWTTDPTTITGTSNTGNKTVWWRVKDTENYEGNAASSLTATINKATPVLNVDGVINTAWNLYDDANHNLFLQRATATIGETTLGTDAISYNARYKAPGGTYGGWFGAKTNPTNSNFTNKKDAGSYQVQIWVEETADYNAVYHKPNNQFVRIDVAKADITGYTEPVAKTGLRANGADQELVEAASWGENTPAGTFSYSLDGINYDAAVPTATDEDNYIVYFKMTPTDATNYNVFENQYAVSIAAANPAYIIPVAANKYYGQTDPALTYTVQNAAGETLDNSVLKGTVELARTNGNNVGEYIIYVKAYTPGADEAYDVANVLNTPTSDDEANKTAVFKINLDPNAKLKLNFTADAIENKSSKVYDGTTAIAALAFDKDDLEADESTLLDGDTWETLKAAATVNFTLANENVALGNQVTVTVTGLANYAAVEVTPLPFAVTPLPITITANDQVIAQGADIAQDEYVTDPAPVAGDDLNIVLTATKSAVGEWDDAIEVSAENANYDFTFVAGKLTINGAGAIALGEGGNDLQLISDYAGQNVNVTINFAGTRNGRNLGGVRNWVKENWVTLTLPFNITVAELSQKLGYAIVNEIDDTKTKVDGTSSEFYGKLTMKGAYGEDYLPANKPIVVKIADDIANVGTAGKVDFGSQLIVAPTDLTVDAGQGAKFVGTYAQKEVSSADDENIWFLIGGGYTKWAYIMSTSGATWTIAPFEAYIDMSVNPGVQAMTFYFEDIDGTVTAISSVDADNSDAKQAAEGWYTLQGVKLESAPTQKGIYIFNGKKVAIQ